MNRTRAFTTTSVFFLLSLSSGLLAAEWHVAPPPLGNDSNPGTSELPFATIQRGIDAASSGDTVIVAEGTYLENIRFDGKNIVLTSTDPLDLAVVAGTIIDGNKAGSVVTFSGTETEACVLAGFTIRNGETPGDGGGICGGTDPDRTRAGIANNVITDNSARRGGGGLCWCGGTIRNNRITGNSAQWGGGLCWCGGTIQNNTITANGGSEGAGLCLCGGTIQNNTITGNSAFAVGGGLCACDGTIQNNTITGNWAFWVGGGLSSCDGVIQNNTMIGNSADDSGGVLYQCNGTIRNCVIWANTSPTEPQLSNSSIPTYSCIQGWTGDSEKRNISEDPRFVDPDGPDNHPETPGDNDYRLSAGSPSIDAGYNDPELPPTDIAGMHRIMYGGKSLTVDMGAWEYYINALSRELGGNAVLTWSSLAGKTYSVLSSSDMLTWQTAAENVPSLGDTTTTWTDTTAPFLSPAVRIRYYRTVEK